MIREHITQMRVVIEELKKSDLNSSPALVQRLTELLDGIESELKESHYYEFEGMLSQQQLHDAMSFTLTNNLFRREDGHMSLLTPYNGPSGKPVFSEKMIFFILDGVKSAGSQVPHEALSHYEEEMTSHEYGDASAFLTWLNENDLHIGHGNIHDRINQWLDEIPKKDGKQ